MALKSAAKSKALHASPTEYFTKNTYIYADDKLISEHSNPFRDIASTIDFFSFTTNSTISFLSFITNFSDSFKSNWSTQEVYGRMDPVSTFKNTSRTISLSFDVISTDAVEGRFNMAKIDTLIQGLYPTYKEGPAGTSILASPPLWRLNCRPLIQSPRLGKGLLGYFAGYDFKPKIEHGFIEPEAIYETNIDSIKEWNYTPVRTAEMLKTSRTTAGGSLERREISWEEKYPRVVQVDLTFSVIHDFELGAKSTTHKPRNEVGNTGTANRKTMYSFPHGYLDGFDDELNSGFFNGYDVTQRASAGSVVDSAATEGSTGTTGGGTGTTGGSTGTTVGTAREATEGGTRATGDSAAESAVGGVMLQDLPLLPDEDIPGARSMRTMFPNLSEREREQQWWKIYYRKFPHREPKKGT